MSRLDSFIRRMMAQRDLLNQAKSQIAEVDGVVFELGLGNGRTFDHLRERFAERDIYVFEYKIAAHESCIPDDTHLYFGDIRETLPRAVLSFANKVALIHNDLGDGREVTHREIGGFLNQHLPKAMAPGGLVLSNMPLELTECEQLPLPQGMQPDRYFIYRRTQEGMVSPNGGKSPKASEC